MYVLIIRFEGGINVQILGRRVLVIDGTLGFVALALSSLMSPNNKSDLGMCIHCVLSRFIALNTSFYSCCFAFVATK